MEVLNNFIGFAEDDEERTDGIYGLFKAQIKQDERDDQSDDSDGYNNQVYQKTKSNEDLFNLMGDDEDKFNFDTFLNQQTQKRVTFANEQLDFRTDDIPHFINEQPDPVIIKDLRNSRSRSRSASAKKRPKSAKKPGFFQAAKRKVTKNSAKKAVINALKGKAYQVKNKPKKSFVNNTEWNGNTNTVGYFDSKLLKQRKMFDEPKEAAQSQKSGLKVKQESTSTGKFFVEFLNDRGNKTGSLTMNKDLHAMQEENENKFFKNIKAMTNVALGKSPLSASKGNKSRSQSKPRQKSLSRTDRETNLELGAIYGGKSIDRKREDDNKTIQKKIQDNFKEKESLIKMLTDELNNEKERRKMMDQEFKNQVKQFESEVRKIKQTSEIAQRNVGVSEITHHESLDMVPTKLNSAVPEQPRIAKTQKQKGYVSVFGKPRLNKTNNKYKDVKSKIKGEMTMPESYKEYKQKGTTSKKQTSMSESVQQTPVKYNISQTDALGSASPDQPIIKPQIMNEKITKESKASLKKKSNLANAAITMMHKNEIERQLQLDLERDMAIELLGKYRQNPNFEMHKIQLDLERINQKLDPIMDKVDQQIHNVGVAKRFKDQANAVGLVSKIAGRYISFYSDELAELLLDDILEETVFEMQKVENQVKRTYINDQQKVIAEEIMSMLIDYDNEAATISTKTQQILSKIPAKKEVKQVPMGMTAPKTVKFEIEEGDIDKIHTSKDSNKGYVNPFTSAIDKAEEYESYEDDFEEDSQDKKGKPKGKQSKQVKQKKPYVRKFEESLEELIKLEGKNSGEEERVYKWRAKVPAYMKENIAKYLKEYEKFLIIHNNTSNKEVWKIYDHITEDIFNDVFNDAVKDLDNIEEYCIQHEFFG